MKESSGLEAQIWTPLALLPAGGSGTSNWGKRKSSTERKTAISIYIGWLSSSQTPRTKQMSRCQATSNCVASLPRPNLVSETTRKSSTQEFDTSIKTQTHTNIHRHIQTHRHTQTHKPQRTHTHTHLRGVILLLSLRILPLERYNVLTPDCWSFAKKPKQEEENYH